MHIPSGLGLFGNINMNTYSIVRIGDEYVVQAGEARILKVASPTRTHHSRVKASLPRIRPKFLDDLARFP